MIDKIIENWSKAQKSGAWLPCPRCGLLKMKEDLFSNALSRRADVYICEDCGTQEEIEDIPYGQKGGDGEFDKLPLEAWFVSRNVFRKNWVVRKGKGFEVTASQNIFLRVQDIDDIMVCAIEGGINYWADAADVIEMNRVAEWGHEQIARNGSLLIHDFHDDETYELTLEKFLTGFKLWFESGRDSCGAVSAHEVDCCLIDGEAADCIIQYALFGDRIYA